MQTDPLVGFSRRFGTDPDYDHLILTDLCATHEQIDKAHRCFLLDSCREERFSVVVGEKLGRKALTCTAPLSQVQFTYVSYEEVKGDSVETVLVPKTLPRTLSDILPEESFASWKVYGPYAADSQERIGIGPQRSESHIVEVESLPIGLQQAIQSLSLGAPPKQLKFLQYVAEYDIGPEEEDDHAQEKAQPGENAHSAEQARRQQQGEETSFVGGEYIFFEPIGEAPDGSIENDPK